MLVLAILVLGAVVGVVMGMLGGGGGAMSVPALHYLFGLDEKSAIAVSLLVVGAASVIGTATQARRGAVAWQTWLVFAVTGGLGSWIGSMLAGYLAGNWQFILFSLLVLGSAALMLRPSNQERAEEAAGAAPGAPADTAAAALAGTPATTPNWAVMLATGFALGMVPPIFGVSGGFLMMPAFVYVALLPVHRAVGTVMAMVATTSLVTAAGYATHMEQAFPWKIALPFLVATCLATFVGATLSHRLSAKVLRLTYVVLLSGLGGYTLVRESVRLVAGS